MPLDDTNIATASQVAAIGAGVLTLGIIAAEFSGPLMAVGVGIVLWNLLPYGILVLLARLQRKSMRQEKVILAGTLAIGILSLILLYDAFFIHVDAQNALALLFLPIYQIPACLLLSVVAKFCR